MKIMSAISFTLFASTLLATELESPYPLNFFTQPSWIPNSVATNETPGSFSTFAITLHTNHTVTAWELAPDSSVTWSLGTEPYYGTFPQWNTDEWSPVDYIFDTDNHDYGSFILDVQGQREEPGGYDEWTEDLFYYLHGYIIEKETGETAAEDSCLAHFTRDVTTEIFATTNIICRRFTEPLQSSFFHTLDGWCEREYFTGLGRNETNHALKTTPLQTIGTNRVINTRRFVGKTNLWNVCERLVDISENGWLAGFSVQDPSPYCDPVSPCWSSQAFDDIYGQQLPDEIYWDAGGLYSLSNKCAVLRGVTNGWVFAGGGTNGWFYTEMFPEDFRFALTNRYDEPEIPPGHDFDFEWLCATNYPHVVINEVTNRTRRFELKTQAAVNQAIGELDRTIMSSGAIVTPSVGTRRYSKVMKLTTGPMTFTEAGLVPIPDYCAWSIPRDLTFNFHVVTNYFEEYDVPDRTPIDRCSDILSLSRSTFEISTKDYSDNGKWIIPTEWIIDDLNSRGVQHPTNEVYCIWVSDAFVRNGKIVIQVRADEGLYFGGENEFSLHPTNTLILLDVTVRHSFDITSASMPSFDELSSLPSDQAWRPGSHLRVGGCWDICTAAQMEFDDEITNVAFHCHVMNRNYGSNFYAIQTNEWNSHRTRAMNVIQRERQISWTSPLRYIDFAKRNIDPYLGSIAIAEDEYIGTSPRPMEGALKVRCDETAHWHVVEGSSNLGVLFSGGCDYFKWKEDREKLEPFVRLPYTTRTRQRLTNFIDWNFNAIRKSE